MNPRGTQPIEILLVEDSPTDVLLAQEALAYSKIVNCYIVKPVDFEKFAEVVKSIENFWFTVVTLPGEN